MGVRKFLSNKKMSDFFTRQGFRRTKFSPPPKHFVTFVRRFIVQKEIYFSSLMYYVSDIQNIVLGDIKILISNNYKYVYDFISFISLYNFSRIEPQNKIVRMIQ